MADKDKFLRLEAVIERILQSNPKARDSDARVIYCYLRSTGRNPDEMTGTQLLASIERGETPALESFSRIRRVVQRRREDLRGTRYHERQAMQADVVDTMHAIDDAHR